MAGPCEVLIDCDSRSEAEAIARAVSAEAWRIEATFSRYRDDNIVHAINTAQGRPVSVDVETAALLDLADTCHQLSKGLFDITSGVLRRVWRFDGSDRVPDRKAVAALLPLIGWHKVRWRNGRISMPAGMEIDFGGIGKEYAVDRALGLAVARSRAPVLVNFGGDIAASAPQRGGRPWRIGVEALEQGGHTPRIELKRGAVATSGDARRYLLRDGVRYSHILDPRTGWPVRGAARSVTVLEVNCTQAGLLSTLAILQGKGAERFLRKQAVTHWIMR